MFQSVSMKTLTIKKLICSQVNCNYFVFGIQIIKFEECNMKLRLKNYHVLF